jgi:hypothetical protein
MRIEKSYLLILKHYLPLQTLLKTVSYLSSTLNFCLSSRNVNDNGKSLMSDNKTRLWTTNLPYKPGSIKPFHKISISVVQVVYDPLLTCPIKIFSNKLELHFFRMPKRAGQLNLLYVHDRGDIKIVNPYINIVSNLTVNRLICYNSQVNMHSQFCTG